MTNVLTDQDHVSLSKLTVAVQIFKEIKHIKDDQSEILRLLRQQAGRTAAENVIIEVVLGEPCENEEQLLHLNKVGNEELRSKLVTLLSTLRGTKLGDSVRKMLRVLGTNNLWSGYSLKRKKTKKAFNSLPICGIIKRACLKIHKNVKVDEVEEQIAETLKHAPAQKDGPKYKQRPQERPQEPGKQAEDN